MQKKLYRIRQGKIFTGVCGGIAKYFGTEAKLYGAVFMEKTDSDLISFLREKAT